MMFEEGNKLGGRNMDVRVCLISAWKSERTGSGRGKSGNSGYRKGRRSLFVHGYMSNAGYEDVRETIARSLNRRFGTSFHAGNILMTVGAASGLNVILKTLLNPGEQVITFAPYFVEYVPMSATMTASWWLYLRIRWISSRISLNLRKRSTKRPRQ